MSESVMRQELTSWLKAECQGVGLDLVDAVVSVSGVVEGAFDLSIPGKTMSASEMLELDLKHTINAITSVPVEYLTTEERQIMFTLANEIRDSISKLRYPTNSIKEAVDIIQKKALRLQSFTQKYLMEKVVECQCGKPGEDWEDRLGNCVREAFRTVSDVDEVRRVVEDTLTE